MTSEIRHAFVSSLALAVLWIGCSEGNTTGTGEGGPSGTAGSGGAGSATGGASTGGAATGGASIGGSVSTGGANPNTGGASGGSTPSAGSSAGGASGTGGAAAGASGTAGTPSTGGSAGMAGGSGTSCSGTWPAADPAVAGPYATVTENEVGPTAGEGADGGAPVRFTMFRPMTLGEGGRCHPVVTWGNGTGSTPNLYGVFLRHLASHGFVVIASNSTNVSRGTPPPMVVGVTWVLEQNDDPASALYQHIDTAHIGATGHSQGGFATSTAGGDSHITTIAPLCGASAQRNLHGPAFIFCGELDTTVPCENVQNGFDSITSQPAMLANYLSADHVNWVTFRGTNPSPVEAAVTAWMRVHLMNDAALRSWFYGPSCRLCADPAWEITQKNMDQ